MPEAPTKNLETKSLKPKLDPRACNTKTWKAKNLQSKTLNHETETPNTKHTSLEPPTYEYIKLKA